MTKYGSEWEEYMRLLGIDAVISRLKEVLRERDALRATNKKLVSQRNKLPYTVIKLASPVRVTPTRSAKSDTSATPDSMPSNLQTSPF